MVEVYAQNRAMHVSALDRVIGCVGDANVRLVRFGVPRYSDGVDMGGWTVEVHYVTADGTSDYTAVVDAQPGEDAITFTWRVPMLACKKAGEVTASVKLLGDNREWNSGIGTFRVVESYDNDPQGAQLVDSAGEVVVVRTEA